MSDLKLDPLYMIFEQHLYDFNDDTETEEAFIDKVVKDYLRWLNGTGAIVPPKMVGLISGELSDQVRTMLRKKMYGCINMDEFVRREKERRTYRRPRSAGKKKSYF